MVDLRRVAWWQQDGDNIKAGGHLGDLVSTEVILGHATDLLLFSGGNGGGRGTVEIVFSRLYLNKDQCSIFIFSDDIDLAAFLPVVTHHNCMPMLAKKVTGQIFS